MSLTDLLAKAAETVLGILGDPWLVLGFCGQFLFMMRFVVQWFHSERLRRSVVPVAFWFFSISGGTVLFSYALYRQDPVFIAGQGLGLLIYARNLYFIFGGAKKTPSDTLRAEAKVIAERLLAQVGAKDWNDGLLHEAQGTLAELSRTLDRMDHGDEGKNNAQI